jgi:hypothetical protein
VYPYLVHTRYGIRKVSDVSTAYRALTGGDDFGGNRAEAHKLLASRGEMGKG